MLVKRFGHLTKFLRRGQNQPSWIRNRAVFDRGDWPRPIRQGSTARPLFADAYDEAENDMDIPPATPNPWLKKECR
jgi:hypothetical protein